MYSNTDVANLALGHVIGSTYKLSSYETEQSTTANVIRKHFESSLETIIQFHPWQFLTKHGPLNLVAEDPSLNWKYSYALPSDAAIVRRIAAEGMFLYQDEYLDNKEPFQIFYDATHGYVINTNVYNAQAEYTVKLSSTGPFLNHFARAFAARLALDIAPSLITNNYFKIKDSLKNDMKNEISNQIAIDISLNPAPMPSDSPFIRVRSNE